jgi:hypothetical protein
MDEDAAGCGLAELGTTVHMLSRNAESVCRRPDWLEHVVELLVDAYSHDD